MTSTLSNNGHNNGSSELHIAAIIPRGEAVRNFVYSETFDELSKQAQLSLLSVEINESLTALFREKYGNAFPLREIDESWFVRIQRDILEIAHGRWLWSRAAKERWRLRDREAQTFRQKTIRAGKKIAGLSFASKSGLALLSSSERATSRLLSSANEYTELYKEVRPGLVFNASHVHSRNAICAVQSAQWLGIPTATFIFSWDNLTSQGRIALPYDYFLVWNESLKQQLLDMYSWIKAENVFVTGTPQFDHHFQTKFYLSREEYCERIGADPKRPMVLYTTGMPNHMPGEPEIVKDIADFLQEYPADSRPQLLLRVYAKDLTRRFEELRRERPDIIFTDPLWEATWLTPKYEDSFALVNALRHCALGINVASTVSLELCMFDKPVINVGYNPASVPTEELSYADYYEFDHYKPVVDSGGIQVAYSEADMRQLIDRSLHSPAHHTAQRKELIERMFGSTLDGRSGNRVADTLLKIAARKVHE